MDSKNFLNVCSRVMHGGKICDNVDDYNKIYNEVYGTDKFLSKLKKSDFPDSPGIQQKCEDLLVGLENMIVVPELMGKSIYSLCGESNSKIIKYCDKKIFMSDNSILLRLTTNVPVIICDSNNICKVEIVNYLNKRIEIDDDEISLILEGEKQGIAVDKIIRYFIVHVPMKIKDVVIVLGANSDLSTWVTDIFDFSTSKAEIKNLIDEMQKNAGSVYFGYLEKCDCILSAIERYFKKTIYNCKKTITAITDDIVRTESEKSEAFKLLRQTESLRCDQLENQFKEISSEIYIFREMVKNLEEKFSVESYDYYSGNYKSTLFEIYFNYIDCGDWNLAKNWEIKISEVNSNLGKIANEYIDLCQNKIKKMSIPEDSEMTWYLAKFLIACVDVSSLSLDEAEYYTNIIEEHISTGKEYFLKALAATDDEKTSLFFKSMSLGYVDATQYIINIYHNSLSIDIENKLLAAVIPEICLNYRGKNSKTYLKMVAAMGNTSAISYLADECFEKYFSKLKQIKKSNKNSDSSVKKKKAGKNLIGMCDYLINENYMAKHYKEIKGEVLFCLRDDYVEAMRCLKQINTDAANYCKAKMYEKGYGVTIDYEEAEDYYFKIKDEELYDTYTAIKRVQKKYEKSIEVEDDDYEEDYDYSETHSYSSYDDGCFVAGTRIYLADGTTKNIEDVEIGDRVLVFDHYRGQFTNESIIANGHVDEDEKECPVIELVFENGKKLEIAIMHGFFDCTENKYICIDYLNVMNYVGHDFLFASEGKIVGTRLLEFNVYMKMTKYYAPVSKFHLNIFADGFLTMVPNEFALNLFDIDQKLKYDLSALNKMSVIEYNQVKNYVSKEEYESYPICFLNAILYNKKMDLSRFTVAISQFRNNRNLKK